MHRLVNSRVVIALVLSTVVLLLACLVLGSELLSRSRFQRTVQFGVMFDTKTARLCDADTPTGAAEFERFMQARQSGENEPAPSRPYCKDLK